MDAVEFLKEERRMCEFFGKTCVKCPFRDTRRCAILLETDEELEKTVAIVEKWSKEYPRNTRQSVFLEQYPNVRLDTNEIIDISPCRVDPKQYPSNDKDCCKFQSCGDCRREFWSKEV